MSSLRVTFSSKPESTIQNPTTQRPDAGTKGGAVPRKICCEGAPLSSLSSGQFSSGEGARRATLSAPFPAPSWVASFIFFSRSTSKGRHEEPIASSRRPAATHCHRASSPTLDSSPRALAGTRAVEGGSSHVGAAVSDYVQGDPPLKKPGI